MSAARAAAATRIFRNCSWRRCRCPGREKATGQPLAGGARFPPPSGGTVRRRVATRARRPDAHAPRTRDSRLSRIRTGVTATPARALDPAAFPPPHPGRLGKGEHFGPRRNATMQAYDDYEDEGLTCHTAPGVTFTTMDELKEHYRSDWHRYNLKRKVAGLPVVGRELFERVMAQAGAASAGKKETGRDHLKRPEEMPRSVARAKRMEEWVENHREEIEAAQAAEAERERRIAAGEDLSDEEDYEEDDAFDEEDDDDSGWESMSDDEAQEVLARMERMAAEDESDDESDDEAEGMELDLSNAPVRLAENGYELIITRDDGSKVRIGPRELRRYYKQRHRPEDQRQMVLAARAENSERGLIRASETRAGERGLSKFDTHGRFQPHHISIMVKRAQNAARKYERNNMFQGNSSIKKFDLNGQNVKIKLPKACPY